MYVGPQWKFYDWPLEARKSWDFVATAFTRGQTQVVTVQTSVLAYEDVKTKAGMFKAYKLQRNWTMRWPGHTGSSWITTVWWAPEVKSLVKSMSTSPGSTDWELVSYSVK